MSGNKGANIAAVYTSKNTTITTELGQVILYYIKKITSLTGSSRSTGVVHWTADQQVERSILPVGHNSYQKCISFAQVVPTQYRRIVQNCDPKHHSCHVID